MQVNELKQYFCEALRLDPNEVQDATFAQMLDGAQAYHGNVTNRKRIREKLFKPVLQTLDAAVTTIKMMEDAANLSSEAPKPKRTRNPAVKKESAE